MRFLKIPVGQGFWAVLYWCEGNSLLLCGFAILLLNLWFSALGILEFTGGKVVLDTANYWFPFLPASIPTGGRVGIAVGIVVGIVCTIIESTTWASPAKQHSEGKSTTIDKKELFVVFSMGILVYDLLSTFYYLNGGIFNLGDNTNWFIAIWDGLAAMLVNSIFSAFISVGSELVLIYGLELVIHNWSEAIDTLIKLGIRMWKFVVKIGGGGGEAETNYKPYNNLNIRKNERPQYRPTFESFQQDSKVEDAPISIYEKPEIHEDDEREVLSGHIDETILPIKRKPGRPPKNKFNLA